MDYKEKLRLAKEALESGSYDKETIEYIFPELAESEDERIRKELISFVRGILACHDKPNAERDEKYESWIAWIEKQGEQKPANNQFTPEQAGVLDKHIDKFLEQNNTWSEENDDDAWLNDIISKAECNLQLNKDEISWLKSLKDRVLPQSKQEWSEEDEYHKKQILRILKDNGCSQRLQEKTEKWIEERLKSIKPQSQWKPSDEQIEALDFAIDCIVWEEFCVKRKVLKGLLEQLRKL